MTAIRFEIARRDDDAQLRQVLAQTPMPGHVRVAFGREPSYFDATVVEGDFCQTLIARNASQVVAVGSRSVRQRFVNGAPHPIGYLSSLRVLPAFRGTGLLARGYRYLHKLHQDGRTLLYLTTIAQGNETALRVLTTGRGGLPSYHFAGVYHTLVMPVRDAWRSTNGHVPDVSIRRATPDDRSTLIRFLQSQGTSRQFFPVYELPDFFTSAGTFHGLRPDELLLAFRQGTLIGTLGAWDQQAFRQVVVDGYSDHVRWTRPFYNGWARLRKHPALPRPGASFPFLTASLPVVQRDDIAVFEALLRQLLSSRAQTVALRHMQRFVLLGMHERDPLLTAARQYSSHEYLTHLYYVCWNDGEALRTQLDSRPPYLELGCL